MSDGAHLSLRRRAELASGPLAQFERMLEIRIFEERVNDLFAAGLIHGTTHLCNGQEALAVGLATALPPTDVVTATYRGHGVGLALGMPPEVVLAEIMGKELGCTGGLGGSMHLCDMDVGLLPTFAIVGAGLPVACGAALAFQTLEEERVAAAVFGDGASNIGAFHEALNLAAVWALPVIFLLDNNVYAEYSRIDKTSLISDLYLRATSYGIPGVVVDGMDPDAVGTAVGEARARAIAGGGPTLIEAKTYRFAGHSRADTAGYRPTGEVDSWLSRDPILQMRNRLANADGDVGEGLADLESAVRTRMEAVISQVSESRDPSISAMFENIRARSGASEC